ncbi:hypothetical protein FOL47_001582 [Perkinsus chesapeaki]|uniref:Carbonic anhydrase n=1 Tax=Perkinsus chesapeaki TaxID=330153 RepID=A0A7J6MI35_PERCH|nr:hypothetical protein FOL47_001582 [Perkinsus chesapeaki]
MISAVAFFLVYSSYAQEWNYSAQNAWPGFCTTGNRQSPINIANVDSNEFAPPFTMRYGTASKVGVHAEIDLAIEIPDANDFTVKGVYGVEQDTFRLTYMDMHWHSDDSQGSEHRINGRQFAYELHFAHYNTKYSNFTEALKHSDGVVAIGVLSSVGPELPGLTKVLDSMDAQNHGSLEEFDVTAMAPPDLATNFYLYNGSGTTPACEEVMVWIVAKTRMTVSEEQLNRLRALKYNGSSIGPNHRNAQPLNGRRVLSSQESKSFAMYSRVPQYIFIIIIVLASALSELDSKYVL